MARRFCQLLSGAGLVLVLVPGCVSPAPRGPERGAAIGKGDGAGSAIVGRRAPAIEESLKRELEVWPVAHRWDEVDDTDAGLQWLPVQAFFGDPRNRDQAVALPQPWPRGAGLTYEEKFQKWLASFGRAHRFGADADDDRATFVFRTPAGRAFDAPWLDCAETALLLRSLFASWYRLPFFVQGGWPPLYAGHFGFINGDGTRYRSAGGTPFPRFAAQYADYRDQWSPGAPWPQDDELRGQRLSSAQSEDTVPFLTAPDGRAAGIGAYLDELLLNKRVGYFVRLLLLYFGSENLREPSNTYLTNDVEAGDLMLPNNIDHAVVITRVDRRPDGWFVYSFSGSAGRIQPLWSTPDVDRLSVTFPGALRRWLTPVEASDGGWRNEPRPGDQEIDAGDEESLAEWVAFLSEKLGFQDPANERAALLTFIEGRRAHLRRFPTSCNARTQREQTFERLYALMDTEFAMDRAEVDRRYRKHEDYVFGELSYDESRTCCWNIESPEMARVILDYAYREATGVDPAVFRAEEGSGDGYDRWRRHASDGAVLERLALDPTWTWPAFADDPGERCGRDHDGTDVTTGRPGQYVEDAWPACEPSFEDTSTNAIGLYVGETHRARLCGIGDTDWYRLEAAEPVRVDIVYSLSTTPDLEVVVIEGSVTDLRSDQWRDRAPESFETEGPVEFGVAPFDMQALTDGTYSIEVTPIP